MPATTQNKRLQYKSPLSFTVSALIFNTTAFMVSSLSFTVRRHEPVLVLPSRPTTHECKPLSDIDDQPGLRFQISGIHFFPNCPTMAGHDPARVIREALSEALVFYYPLAGRLRETVDGKLFVECTGEGVLFIEADAGIRLEQFGDHLQPPFPCIEELLHEDEGSAGIVNCPLFLVQVTRLECGGFIFAHRINHAVADATGTVQFIKAIADLARGAALPTVLPVWERELLIARTPACPTHPHPEYQETAPPPPIQMNEMVQQCFFFGTKEMSALREHMPRGLRTCSLFDIVTGLVWRTRTIALDCDPDVEIRVLLVINGRGRSNPPLPVGFYGNAFAFLAAQSTAGHLCCQPLEYAVGLVREAKAAFDESYLQSVADLMVLRGRPHFVKTGTFVVSDVRRAGFDEVEFQWGEAAYAGPAVRASEPISHSSFYIVLKNTDGILVTMYLPGFAMERFKAEIEKMTVALS